MTPGIRRRVEDAVIELLADMKSAEGVRDVRPYAGELGIEKVEDLLRALGTSTPGILVTTERGDFKGVQVQRRRYRREIDITLYIVSSSQTTREARLRGTGQIYDILDSLVARLVGLRPDLGDDVRAGHLEPVSEDVVAHNPVIAVWSQKWQVTVEIDLAQRLAPDITEFHGRTNFAADEDSATNPVTEATTLTAED